MKNRINYKLKGDKVVGKVKICGLKRLKEIEIVNNFLPDYIGFVLAPSKRQISLEQAKELKAQLHPSIQAVGVFVNAPIEEILSYEKQQIIDIVQLHGNENLVYINSLKKASDLKVIKAITIKDEASLEVQKSLLESELIDYVLLDAYHPKVYGGTGKSFNWQLLNQIHRPYFLAGGIGLDNLEEALKYKPYAIDISSKVEVAGIKDEALVKAVIERIRE